MDIGSLAPAIKCRRRGEMTLELRRIIARPDRLTLFGWHASLFPTGYSGMRKIAVARWRGFPRPAAGGFRP